MNGGRLSRCQLLCPGRGFYFSYQFPSIDPPRSPQRVDILPAVTWGKSKST